MCRQKSKNDSLENLENPQIQPEEEEDFGSLFDLSDTEEELLWTDSEDDNLDGSDEEEPSGFFICETCMHELLGLPHNHLNVEIPLPQETHHESQEAAEIVETRKRRADDEEDNSRIVKVLKVDESVAEEGSA